MKKDYSKVPMPKLVDLLAEETQKFTHMLTYKQYGKEYDKSKKKIHALTAAIRDQKENSPQVPGNRINSSHPNS